MQHISTKQLFNNLISLKKILYLLENGLFPGMAFKDIEDSFTYLKPIYEGYLKEFKTRDDRKEYDPNIDAVPGIQGAK
jgi:hypothetical protein